jgi:hypothetical protein
MFSVKLGGAHPFRHRERPQSDAVPDRRLQQQQQQQQQRAGPLTRRRRAVRPIGEGCPLGQVGRTPCSRGAYFGQNFPATYAFAGGSTRLLPGPAVEGSAVQQREPADANQTGRLEAPQPTPEPTGDLTFEADPLDLRVPSEGQHVN